MDTVPWLTGRFANIARRQRDLAGGDAALPPPWIAITEQGWSNLRIDGQLRGWPIVPLMDEWRRRGIQDPEAEAFRQLREVWEQVYKPSGVIVGMALYQYGGNTTRSSSEFPYLEWTDWDWRRLPRAVEMIANYQEETEMAIQKRVKLTFDFGSLNLRVAPALSGAILKQLKSGDVGFITLPLESEQRDGYNWTQFKLENGITGFIAFGPADKISVRFDAVDDSPPPPAPPPNSITVTVQIGEENYGGEIPRL